jgi:hypothetical protein
MTSVRLHFPGIKSMVCILSNYKKLKKIGYIIHAYEPRKSTQLSILSENLD